MFEHAFTTSQAHSLKPPMHDPRYSPYYSQCTGEGTKAQGGLVVQDRCWFEVVLSSQPTLDPF